MKALVAGVPSKRRIGQKRREVDATAVLRERSMAQPAVRQKGFHNHQKRRAVAASRLENRPHLTPLREINLKLKCM